MAKTSVIEQQMPAPADDLEVLLSDHRHWRARLREAIEDSRRVRTNGAAVRDHRRGVSTLRASSTEA